MSKNDILVLEEVSRNYPGFLLEGVSFSLQAGSIMGLLGPNGAGKTTIIKLILNLIRPDSGFIRVFGLDSSKDEIEIKKNLGYLGENVNLLPSVTGEWLGSYLSVCFPSWDDGLFKSYLERFRVPARKKVKTLSKGNRTKLGLSLAMGHRPALLVLDEPTSGLDSIIRHEVTEAVKEIVREEGRAVLFSSHIVSDLEACADEIVVVNEGRLLLAEDKDDLLAQYKKKADDEGKSPLTLEEIFRHLVDRDNRERGVF